MMSNHTPRAYLIKTEGMSIAESSDRTNMYSDQRCRFFHCVFFLVSSILHSFIYSPCSLITSVYNLLVWTIRHRICTSLHVIIFKQRDHPNVSASEIVAEKS